MTDWTMQSTSGDAQILSRRLGAFLKRQGSAKQLALRLDCDERTARNLVGGVAWPIARHWWNIWVEFGDDVLEAVFHPERVEARLAREAAEREQARQRRRAASALVEVRAFGVGGGLARDAGQVEGSAAELDPGPPNLDLFEGVEA